MICGCMLSQCIPCSESLITKVAGNDDVIQVIEFNVIFYVVGESFLSTYFAQRSKATTLRDAPLSKKCSFF